MTDDTGTSKRRTVLFIGIGCLVTAMLAVVALAAFFLLGIGSIGSLVQLGTDGEGLLSNADIERLIDMSLPASAANVRSYVSSFQDTFAQIRFEIPASDVPQYVASMPPGTVMRSDQFSLQPNDYDWWRPHEAQQFQWATIESAPSWYRTVLIDTTDPNLAIVYWQVIRT